MTDHFLALDTFNVIIVGDGAIGSALLANLLERPALQHAIVLGRGDKSTLQDPRITRLSFDASEPESIVRAATRTGEMIGRAHLLVNTVGLLHSGHQQPEKQLRSLDPQHLQQSFLINAMLLPLLAQAFGKLLRHDEPAMLASLSARVGSIEDNKAGGWYSYRASKAAHNMLLKTVALEWKLSHRKTTVVALHPGTVLSKLSEPFISPGYAKPVLSPAESAEALLQVMSQLQPEHSGSFYDWQGQCIPW